MTNEPANDASGVANASGNTTARQSTEQQLDSRTLTLDKSEGALDSNPQEGAVEVPVVQAQKLEKQQVQTNRKDFGFLPIPRKLQYDPERPFVFTMVLNVAFGFGSTFSEFFIV